MINNATWGIGENITSAKLNGMVADANNAADEIHPQYREYKSAIPFIAGIMNSTAGLFAFTGRGAQMQYGAALTAQTPPVNQFTYSFQKRGNSTLTYSFNYSQNGTNNNFSVQYQLFKKGINDTTAVAQGSPVIDACPTSPSSISSTFDLTGFSSTDIIEFQISVYTTGTAAPTGGHGFADTGQFYNLVLTVS